ncbi:uncharacterized protein BKA55DRAFT_743860 [Fusarium redolens]|uniref:Uncharacterized protein n=1 Tax=Fusarium redolens TaxID=48865 RepID=A0A9P9JLD0_FUSRE|nr:uncharacterized protein BKA55DRAFT_743860 [Fusarium redolens]KAH7222619.1 hypothetical protein BKA55DRAFT_743860 [Fusarium redolens]
MKPVAILLALASTAFTVSAGGLPRFAKCTAPSQCISSFCANMPGANCDENPNCHDRVCWGAPVNSLCSNDWECNSNHCKGGRCYDCRDPRNNARAAPPYLSIGSDSQINAASHSVEQTFRGICNALIIW